MSTEGIPVRVTLNGVAITIEVAPNAVLADVLAESGLSSVRVSCDQNVCGACTVLVDGQPTASCSTFAFQVDGRAVETVEGIAQPNELHSLQKAFVENYAFQCGFCTPGMLMACKALLDHSPHPTPHEIRHWLRGNICRCTGYGTIVAAVESAAGRTEQ